MNILLISSILLLFFTLALFTVRTIIIKYRSRFLSRKMLKRFEYYDQLLRDFLAEKQKIKIVPLSSKLGDLDAIFLLIEKRYQILSNEEKRKSIKFFSGLGFVSFLKKEILSDEPVRKGKAALLLATLGCVEEKFNIWNLLNTKDMDLHIVGVKALGRLAIELRNMHREDESELIIGIIAGFLDKPELIPVRRLSEIILEIGEACNYFLEIALDANKSSTRALAADLLGKNKSSGSSDKLISLLKDSDIDVKARVISALGELKCSDATLHITDLLKDDLWVLRAQAAKALGVIADIRAIVPLKVAMSDNHWWVRYNSSYSLAQLGNQGVGALISLLHSPDRFARERATEVLEEIGEINNWINGLEDNDSHVRSKSVKYLTNALKAGALSQLATATFKAEKVEVASLITQLWKEFFGHLVENIRVLEANYSDEKAFNWILDRIDKLNSLAVVDYLKKFRRYDFPSLDRTIEDIEGMFEELTLKADKLKNEGMPDLVHFHADDKPVKNLDLSLK